MPDALLDRIAAAGSLADLEQLRVGALGKQGEITAKLKSLGSMDPDTRSKEAPKIHALREQVTSAIADRKAGLEAAQLDHAPAEACGVDVAGEPTARPHRQPGPLLGLRQPA